MPTAKLKEAKQGTDSGKEQTKGSSGSKVLANVHHCFECRDGSTQHMTKRQPGLALPRVHHGTPFQGKFAVKVE